jgi:hypothetical protein
MVLSISWLFRLHIAQDANFRLNNRAHALGHLDPPLQPGSAYMVDPVPLQHYVIEHADEEEVRGLLTSLYGITNAS